MQKVAILLRKTSVPNRFRRIVLAALAEPSLTACMVASGFFQERDPVFVSPDIIAGLGGAAATKIVTFVGVHNWGWNADYRKFLDEIHTGCPNVTLNRCRIPGYGWHAKIFIASNATGPILAVIGSSNMTGRAFQELSAWNYESDVVLWHDDDPVVSSIVRRSLSRGETEEDAGGVMITTYDPADPINRGQPLRYRLQQILDEIDEASETF